MSDGLEKSDDLGDTKNSLADDVTDSIILKGDAAGVDSVYAYKSELSLYSSFLSF